MSRNRSLNAFIAFSIIVILVSNSVYPFVFVKTEDSKTVVVEALRFITLTSIIVSMMVSYLNYVLFILRLVNIIAALTVIGNLVISWLLNGVSRDSRPSDHMGMKIGCVERLIIFLLLWIRVYDLIVIIFSLKSIIRFKEYNISKTNDYFIYGNLLSFLYVLLVYILVLAS